MMGVGIGLIVVTGLMAAATAMRADNANYTNSQHVECLGPR